MTVKFHRLVQRDAWEIMRYYERESGRKLADEFHDEFMAVVRAAAENPERNHFDSSGLRRAALRRFPHHFLYRVRRDDILILVLRHDKRHPAFGVRRR
jgi:plasmid stabilization system protein ParE